MILAVKLIGLLVVEGVGGDVHPGPGVEHLEPVAVSVGQERSRDVVQVFDQGVISGIPIPLNVEDQQLLTNIQLTRQSILGSVGLTK